jgi:hypothetical protein
MPTQCTSDLFGFAPVEGRKVVASFDVGNISSDAGSLLLGATDRAIVWTDLRNAFVIYGVRTSLSMRLSHWLISAFMQWRLATKI